MKDREVHINELSLRIPGVNIEESGNIGAEVARRLADNLPDSFNKSSFTNVNLKVSIPQGTSRQEVTRLISEAILQRLI
jgi:hypothetical protein